MSHISPRSYPQSGTTFALFDLDTDGSPIGGAPLERRPPSRCFHDVAVGHLEPPALLAAARFR